MPYLQTRKRLSVVSIFIAGVLLLLLGTDASVGQDDAGGAPASGAEAPVSGDAGGGELQSPGVPDLLAAVFPAFVSCVEEQLLRQTFEQQIPGQWPSGWVRLWGDSTEDSLAINNFISLEGNQSLQLNRQIENMYGIACKMPSASLGTQIFAGFGFQIEGPGNRVSLTIELRQGTQRSSSLGTIALTHRNVIFNGRDRDRKTAKTLGKYEEGKWYVLLLSIPTQADREMEAVMLRQPQAKDGGLWEEVGRSSVSSSGATKDPVYFSLTTGPKFTGYTFSLDDLYWCVCDVQQKQAPDESEPAAE